MFGLFGGGRLKPTPWVPRFRGELQELGPAPHTPETQPLTGLTGEERKSFMAPA